MKALGLQPRDRFAYTIVPEHNLSPGHDSMEDLAAAICLPLEGDVDVLVFAFPRDRRRALVEALERGVTS